MNQFTFSPCPLPALSTVWLYLRDSGGETQDLGSQRAYALAYCEHHRLQVERIFEDAARPGSSTVGRDEFELMIELSRSSKKPLVDAVLVWSVSRFARNEIDSAYYKAHLRRSGYEIVYLSEDVPTDRRFGPLYEKFLEISAQEFLDRLSKDTKRGLHYIVGLKDAKGQYLGIFPGRPPTFFTTQRLNLTELYPEIRRNDGRHRVVQQIIPDPDTWERGRRAWQMRAERAGYRQIEEQLNLFPNVANPASTYSAIFRNEIYVGRLRYGGRVYENFVPALATPEQWEAVQAQRYTRKKGASFATKNGKTSYLLSGLCKCFYCQSSMHGMRNKRNDRTKYWRFYACARKWAKRDRCDSKQTSAERLEQSVIGGVAGQVLTVDRFQVLIEQVNLALSDTAGAQREMERLQREIKKLDRAVGNLLHMAELTPSPAIARQLEARELELRQTRRQAEALAQRSQQTVLRIRPEVIGDLLGQLNRGSLEAKRRILNRFVNKIEVARDVATIHYRVGLATLVDYMPPTGFAINQCQQGKVYSEI